MILSSVSQVGFSNDNDGDRLSAKTLYSIFSYEEQMCNSVIARELILQSTVCGVSSFYIFSPGQRWISYCSLYSMTTNGKQLWQARISLSNQTWTLSPTITLQIQETRHTTAPETTSQPVWPSLTRGKKSSSMFPFLVNQRHFTRWKRIVVLTRWPCGSRFMLCWCKVFIPPLRLYQMDSWPRSCWR